MRLLASLLAGLLLTGILALEPDTSFARGGGGGAHFGGFRGELGSRGVGDRGMMFHRRIG